MRAPSRGERFSDVRLARRLGGFGVMFGGFGVRILRARKLAD